MYYLSLDACRLLYNLVAHPWECMTRYDPTKMCDSIRKMLSDISSDLYFDAVAHPVIVSDGIIFRAYVSVMNKEPELVLGIVDRVILKDMVLTLIFTDRFGDTYSLYGVSFRTTGTEGISLDTIEG